MKLFKYIIIGLITTWMIYVICIYLTGKKETFLIRSGFEGTLIILANQPDGIEINESNVIYDFTNTNIIKLKGNLITGFSPWGYLNYYEINENNERKKLKTKDERIEELNSEDNFIYVWENYFSIGTCNGTDYEALVISKQKNIDSTLSLTQKMINQNVCSYKFANP
ncbi:MAG: hypothetical protein MH472_09375 [Bacteroidia bacterium]|nr:hypothetical protein [Bacteroidia bacterium]